MEVRFYCASCVMKDTELVLVEFTKPVVCFILLRREPRQVEVRFYCASDSLNLLASIKEKSTCK